MTATMPKIKLKGFQRFVLSFIFQRDAYGRMEVNKKYRRILIRVYRQCGKSWLFAYLAVLWASVFPNSTIVIITPTISQGLDVYWRDHSKLFYMLGETPFRKSEKDARISLHNGSTIIIRGVDNIENRRGITADLVLCDEMAYYPLGTYVRVLAPLTRARNGITLFASTPQTLKGNEFYETEQKILNKEWVGKVIHMGIYDDPSLSPAEREEIERDYIGKPQDFKREALAEYGSMEAKAFPMYDTTTHIISYDKFEFNPYLPVLLGIDFGYSPDPNAVVFLQQQGKYIYQFDEHVGYGETTPTLYQSIKEKLAKYNPVRVEAYCDPSNPGAIATLNQSAVAEGSIPFFYKGRSDMSGWDGIRQMMAPLQRDNIEDVTEIAKPQFRMTSICANGIVSYSNFQDLPGSARKVEKTQNHEYSHSPDALKYAVNSGRLFIQNSEGEVSPVVFQIQEMYMPRAESTGPQKYLTDLSRQVSLGYDPNSRNYDTI